MEKYLVLMVDDDPMSNTFSSLVLKKQNPNTDIVSFNTGFDALGYLRNPSTEKPNVIFLDLNMPVMNGWDFMDEFEKLGLEVEVVLVTSSNDPMDRERCKHYRGIKEYFVKPISIETVQEYFLRRF